MDFVDEIKALAAKVPGLLEHIVTEAGTRTSLVEPFIRALGYDTSDPTEVVPEFGANVKVPGVNQDKHVDYAIMKDGKPIILIEVKQHGTDPNKGYSQLFGYFTPVDARIAIATNGVIYRFYADLEKDHVMDKEPFLELDMLNLKEPLVEELKRLTKSVFDVDEMVRAGNELRFVGGILEILTQQKNSTDPEFAKYFFQQLCPGKAFAGTVKQEFANFTHKALNQFVREQIKSLLDVTTPSPISTPTPAIEPVIEPIPDLTNEVVTTSEEIEAFYIVKSILHGKIETARIGYKDVQNYFNVLLDSKVNKPICRFYFNNSKNMRLGLFSSGDNGKQEEKVAITSLDEIYQYADRLKATVNSYNSK
jgi:hypothetical protein